MKRLCWIVMLPLTLACGGPSSEPAPRAVGANTVATYVGGEIDLSEIEQAFPEARTPACLTARRARGGGCAR